MGGIDEQTPGERLVEERVRAALKRTHARRGRLRQRPLADADPGRWAAARRGDGPARRPSRVRDPGDRGQGRPGRSGRRRPLVRRQPTAAPKARSTRRWWARTRSVDMIAADPRWGGRDDPRMLHAVAFPDTDRESLGAHTLGPDAPIELVIDRADLTDETATAKALDRIFRFWSGDGARDRPLNRAGPSHDPGDPGADHPASVAPSRRHRGRRAGAPHPDPAPAGRPADPAAGASRLDRGRRRQRQDARGDREGPAARLGGLQDALRLLQPAAGAGGRRRARPGPVHRGRDADRHDLPRAVPAAWHRGPHAAAQARATRPGLVGRRAAARPGRRDQDRRWAMACPGDR